MKGYKDYIISNVESLEEIDKEKLILSIDDVYHDLKLLKKEYLQDFTEGKLVTSSIKSMINEHDMFLLLSTTIKSEIYRTDTILIKHHELALNYISELYSKFDFKIDDFKSVLLLVDLLSKEKFLTEDTRKSDFLLKQTLIPLSKRI